MQAKQSTRRGRSVFPVCVGMGSGTGTAFHGSDAEKARWSATLCVGACLSCWWFRSKDANDIIWHGDRSNISLCHVFIYIYALTYLCNFCIYVFIYSRDTQQFPSFWNIWSSYPLPVPYLTDTNPIAPRGARHRSTRSSAPCRGVFNPFLTRADASAFREKPCLIRSISVNLLARHQKVDAVNPRWSPQCLMMFDG